jgi:hypothetical protein
MSLERLRVQEAPHRSSYAHDISVQAVIALIVAAPAVILLFSLGRAAWRMFFRNEESESGGSHGQQIVQPPND